jgi:hypothetical protein
MTQKKTVEEIKSGKKACPNCLAPMPYEGAPVYMRSWAPGEYVWRCRSCVTVFIHDGRLDQRALAWAKRRERAATDDLLAALNFMARGDQPDADAKKRT